jgi:hypothetical protein
MLVGPGSFYVLACHFLLDVVVGAFLLGCQMYVAFVGVLERLLCLVA